ncbi:MAG: type II toxin-antitoxin system RelE/ParE family toxin [Oscillospiraceae bacterium]|nr:type II toxin-antitoxin system RelE/ParE family toxin [Oscillospiraceae bacterium]
MSYRIEFIDEAAKDLEELDASVKRQVDAAILKVSKNTLPKNEGGFGNPLGNKHGNNLTGFCKIKLLKLGIRVVYELVRIEEIMKIVVIAARADEEVYEITARRIKDNRQ